MIKAGKEPMSRSCFTSARSGYGLFGNIEARAMIEANDVGAAARSDACFEEKCKQVILDTASMRLLLGLMVLHSLTSAAKQRSFFGAEF